MGDVWGTHPELHKRDVPTKGMCDIFESKDVLKKSSPGVMDTRLQSQAEGGSTSHPGHDIPQDQLLTNGEERWQQATEVMTTTVLKSMSLEKGQDMIMNQDEALVEEPLDHPNK